MPTLSQLTIWSFLPHSSQFVTPDHATVTICLLPPISFPIRYSRSCYSYNMTLSSYILPNSLFLIMLQLRYDSFLPYTSQFIIPDHATVTIWLLPLITFPIRYSRSCYSYDVLPLISFPIRYYWSCYSYDMTPSSHILPNSLFLIMLQLRYDPFFPHPSQLVIPNHAKVTIWPFLPISFPVRYSWSCYSYDMTPSSHILPNSLFPIMLQLRYDSFLSYPSQFVIPDHATVTIWLLPLISFPIRYSRSCYSYDMSFLSYPSQFVITDHATVTIWPHLPTSFPIRYSLSC
jgi:hypothetical protein